MFYKSFLAPLIDNLDKKKETLSGNKKASFFFNKKLLISFWWSQMIKIGGDCV